MLDVDGVIYDWHYSLYEELVIYGKIDCDYYTFWSEKYKEYSDSWWDNVVRFEHLYGTTPLKPEDKILLEKLSKKYEIFYVTKRPEWVRFATESWFRRYELPQRENLIFTTKDKSLICNSLGIQVAVEDMLSYAKDLMENGVLTIIKRMPYNEKSLQKDWLVINSFTEAERFLL